MHLSCDKMLCIYGTKRNEEVSNKVSNPIIDAQIILSGVRISDYVIYCRLQEIQVSNPGESGLLNNYADYRGKACKGFSTWCK
ncbi:hypothetical protein YC2023_069031 [Brassica napus]